MVTALDTIESVLAGYDRACETAQQVAATHGPDEVVHGHRMGAMTLRWIHLQVLRELAQHSGHADILREQLLAARIGTMPGAGDAAGSAPGAGPNEATGSVAGSG